MAAEPTENEFFYWGKVPEECDRRSDLEAQNRSQKVIRVDFREQHGYQPGRDLRDAKRISSIIRGRSTCNSHQVVIFGREEWISSCIVPPSVRPLPHFQIWRDGFL